jgi:type II secretory pathway pseudopilin PulG
VDGVTRTQLESPARRQAEHGFSLIETMVAMGVMSAGLMALVGVFALGVTRMATSSPMLIAREKAREAVESVHAARDTAELAWNTVKNTSETGGVFLTGPQSLKLPGLDGLVNTADDGAIETMRKPGANGILNDSDDELVPLRDFTRENPDYSPQLRQRRRRQPQPASGRGDGPLQGGQRVARLHADDVLSSYS